MIPQNLRINADDFGRDSATTEGIAQAVQDGLINSFSVMPCRDVISITSLKEIAVANPEIRIGVHLSLVDVPFLHPDTPRFSDARSFPADFREFLLWYASGKINSQQVYREWRTQIELAASLVGGASRLFHLDSHQHLHVLPGLWPIALRLQREFGLTRLRLPYESLLRSIGHRFPLGFAFQALACWQGGWRPSSDYETFVGFFQSTEFSFERYRHNLERAIQSLRPCELMVHQEWDELRKLKNWLEARGT